MSRKSRIAFVLSSLALAGTTVAGVTLCATSVRAETTSATEPGPVGKPFDHLACFRVRDALHFRAQVELDFLHERFGLPTSCKVVGRSRALCAPVSKKVLRLRYRDGSDMAPIDMPGVDQSEARVCYHVRCRTEPFIGPLHVEDQFGRRRVRELEIKRLCTNARLLGDVATTTTTTTLPDPCALLDCADGHFCRPSCEDPNAAACVAYSNEGETCRGFVPRCIEQRCAPGLECVVPLPGDDGPIDLPGVCVKTDDGECVSDEDCPDGFVCASSGYGADGTPLKNVCIPGCRSDEDCAPGQRCLPTPCPGPPCADQCVDVDGCTSDDDCPAGEVCEPSGRPYTELYPERLVCVPGCRSDEHCAPEKHCEPVVCITSPCPPVCVPDPPPLCGTCSSDADCPEGARCSAGDICLPPCDCPSCLVCSGDCIF